MSENYKRRSKMGTRCKHAFKPFGMRQHMATDRNQDPQHESYPDELTTEGLERDPARETDQTSGEKAAGSAPQTNTQTGLQSHPEAEDGGRAGQAGKLRSLLDSLESVGVVLASTLATAAGKISRIGSGRASGSCDRVSVFPGKEENLRSAGASHHEGTSGLVSAVADAGSPGDHGQQSHAIGRHDDAGGWRERLGRESVADTEAAESQEGGAESYHDDRTGCRSLQSVRSCHVAAGRSPGQVDRHCSSLACGRRIVLLLWISNAGAVTLSIFEAIINLGEFPMAIGIARPIDSDDVLWLVVLRPGEARGLQARAAGVGIAGNRDVALAKSLLEFRNTADVGNRFRLAVEQAFFGFNLESGLPRWWSRAEAKFWRNSVYRQALQEDCDHLAQLADSWHCSVDRGAFRSQTIGQRPALQQPGAGDDVASSGVEVSAGLRCDSRYGANATVLNGGGTDGQTEKR